MASSTTNEPGTESAKKNAILAAALELFALAGFAATPVPRIAERAGVGAGTIYRYFASKEDLLNELYRHWKEIFFHYMTDDLPAQAGSEAKFRHLYRGLVRFEQEHPLAFAFLEFHHHEPNLDEDNQRRERELYDFVFEYTGEAVRSGAIRALPGEAVIALVFGGFTALVKARRAGRLAFDEGLLREMEDCCWAALRK